MVCYPVDSTEIGEVLFVSVVEVYLSLESVPTKKHRKEIKETINVVLS
jgi:hypothetical protein